MPLEPGTHIGPYEIQGTLGAGGMGEVYRATDTNLRRQVAIKVLPDEFARDADRLARFEREARTLAALNHPNIAQIYGVEAGPAAAFAADAASAPKEAGHYVRALIMELVEGPTLANRLAHGPLTLDEALPIARQIAEALEAAHELGIVHRDLKPANIKVRDDGTVKVLDFGLAKVIEPSGVSPTASSSTITTPGMTQIGTILGTAAYMSPEQARGKPADKRSDIWAFGCVLYEMLAGTRAFGHEDVTESLARVLTQDPQWSALPSKTPATIHRLLRRCLAKDRRQRLSDAAAVRLDVIDAQNEPRADASSFSRRSGSRLVWATAALMMVAAAVLAWALRPMPRNLELRVEIATPPTTDPFSVAISPDGRKLVSAANVDGRNRLWLRDLESGQTRWLPGTDDGGSPFWSPDCRSVGFFTPSKLKRIDIDTGSVHDLANASGGRGGTWSANGIILYTSTAASSIMRISDAGGNAVAVTQLDPPRQASHRLPQFLQDDEHFLYYAAGTPAGRGVYIGRLDGTQGRRLLDADSSATYASGHLFFVRERTLFAQPFDPNRRTVEGRASPVASGLAVSSDIAGVAALSVSTTGVIVYRTDSSGGRRQLAWFDRSGKEIAKVGDVDTTGKNPALSPDGRLVAIQRGASDDIWIIDLSRGVPTRFTTDPAFDIHPVWSPDSNRIVFGSNRSGQYDIFVKSLTSTGGDDLVVTKSSTPSPTQVHRLPSDWSSDGRFLLVRSVSELAADIWALSFDGRREPFPVVQTDFDERDAQFAPDGKWIAYQSNESGDVEIYVQSFPGPGGKQRISQNGGGQVRWRRDGKELFYIARGGQLVAVPITFRPDHHGIEAGAPVPLFNTYVGGAVQGNGRQQYDVSRDGQRFLMSTIPEEAPSPVSVILNWASAPSR